MIRISPYQDLFIKQELTHGTSLTNVLKGRAEFSSVEFDFLRSCVVQVVHNSLWARLRLDATKNIWVDAGKLNGSINFYEQKETNLSISGELWSICLYPLHQKVVLELMMHHALADAHSFQLFWAHLKDALSGLELATEEVQEVNYLFDEAEIGEIKEVEAEGLGPVKRFTLEIPGPRKSKLEKEATDQKLNFSTILLGALQTVLDSSENLLNRKLQTGIALRNRTVTKAKKSFLTAVNFLPVPHHGIFDLPALQSSIKHVFRNQSFPLLEWLRKNQRNAAFNVLFSYQKEAYHDSSQGNIAELTFLPSSVDETILGVHVLDFGERQLKISFDYRLDIADEIFWRGLIFQFLQGVRKQLKKAIHPVQFMPARCKAAFSGRIPFWEGFQRAAEDKLALITEQEKLTFGELKSELRNLSLDDSEIVSIEPDRSSKGILKLLKAWEENKCVTFHGATDVQIPKGNFLYLASTSGSTGKPKKIFIKKSGIETLLFSWEKQLQLSSNSIHLSIADQRFDVFMGDLFRSIISGNTLVLASEAQRFSSSAVADLINKYQVTHLESTPSLLHLSAPFLSSCSSLRFLIAGSEPLTAELFTALRGLNNNDLCVINSYGLTEVSIDSCLSPLQLYGENYFPSGFPLGDQEFLIMNEKREILPFGVWGELVIAGDCVGIPATTDEEKYAVIEGKNAYFTGDKAMLHSLYGLIVKGRFRDDFIKVHGKRIPARDIELYLTKYGTVSKAWVFAKEGVAVLAHDASHSEEQLRSFLLSQFSQFQLPDLIVFVDDWPINKNGKIDKESVLKKIRFPVSNDAKWIPGEEQCEQVIWRTIDKMKKNYGSLDEVLTFHGWNSIELLSFCNEMTLVGFPLNAAEVLKQPTIRNMITQLNHKSVSLLPNTGETNLDDGDISSIMDILNR